MLCSNGPTLVTYSTTHPLLAMANHDLVDPGKKLKDLSKDGQQLGWDSCHTSWHVCLLLRWDRSISSFHLRRLRRAIQKSIPDSCKEDHELVPGGDLRCAGNQWLRRAFQDSKVQRVPREGEVRKVIGQLTNLLDI